MQLQVTVLLSSQACCHFVVNRWTADGTQDSASTFNLVVSTEMPDFTNAALDSN